MVDSGLVKQREFDSVRGTSSLTIGPISKSSADQRKGRAGRTAEGTCYRLYSEKDYESMSDHFVPELLRSNLGLALLQLKVLGA